jgi:cation-transporting ATPase I
VVEARLGPTIADVGLALGNAMAQAFAQGPLGLVVDIGHRANLALEAQARRHVWARREGELYPNPRPDPIPALEPDRRAVPLAAGPVERYGDRTSMASLAAFGVTLAATQDPRRAADVLLAGMPKAARLGREAFAAQFDRVLARRGVVVMDTSVLRCLDRVDTVVIEAGLFGDDMGDELAQATARAGHELIVAGGASVVAERLNASRVDAGGLADAIRRHQAEGRTVALVSANYAEALRVADCGIGIEVPDRHPPWSAALLCGPDPANAALVIDAMRTAREVSQRSVLFALAGSSTGGLWALVGLRQGAARRAMIPVNLAAMLAVTLGAWSGLRLAPHQTSRIPNTPAWHELDTDTALAALDTSLAGLSSDQQAGRRSVRPEPPAAPSFVRAVAGELANPLTPLLGLGAGLAAAVGSATDAALIGVVVMVNALLSGTQRVRTEASLAKLGKRETSPIRVRTNGQVAELAPEDLVIGDVVELASGDVVPADCRLLEAASLEVDESSLTGESLPVLKTAVPTPGLAVADRACMVYADTAVAAGKAVALVIATGPATEAARGLSTQGEAPPTGVEARVAALTKITVPVTLASGAVVSALGLLRRVPVREAISSGVSLMVAAVPEGLPLLATASQLAAAKRLTARNAFVPHPHVIEALGRVDLLCFDKTGTLTEARIGVSCVSDGITSESLAALGPRGRAILAAALRASPHSDAEEILPHATDQAIVDAADQATIGTHEGLGHWRHVEELAFESARAYHAVVGRDTNGLRLAVKGAPETLLPRCVTWRAPDRPRPLDDTARRQLGEGIEGLARQGQRVLAVAERTTTSQTPLDESDLRDLELLGFLGLADLVRQTAAAAISDLRRAGVAVVMVTGDHPSTAQAIAAELGLLDGGRVITGSELDTVGDDDLDMQLADTTVFARVTPIQKVRIVQAYQRGGRTVAMTGDGSNDAPAMRLADAAIALGGRGTPAAKSAASLVVVDDRVETIIDAIVEGRAMWSSVRDALAILVGGNLGEVAFTLTGTIISGRTPLNARQLLLVNLLTDMLPALTIALRPPKTTSPDALLHEGPEISLGGALTRDIAIRAAATSAGATTAWLAARLTGTPTRARTVGLTALVGTQLAQTAVAGGRSPLVLGATALSAAALGVVVQTPGLSQFFGCRPLGPVGWLTATGASIGATGASVVLPWAFEHAREHVRQIAMDARLEQPLAAAG